MYDADCLEKIGANVKFLRTMRKLRQQDVAQTLGISQTHLSNMECGRVKFSCCAWPTFLTASWNVFLTPGRRPT